LDGGRFEEYFKEERTMAGDRNTDRIDQPHEATRGTDNLHSARTDNSPGAFLAKTDTASYQLHDLHINGAEDLPGFGTNQKVGQNEAFKQTGSETKDGNTTNTFQGQLNDGIPLWRTNATIKETVNEQNQVQRLDVHYDSKQTIVVPGEKEGSTGFAKLNDVTDVSIVPLANGESVMRFNKQSVFTGGNFDTLLLDQNGKVMASGDSTNHNGGERDLTNVAATHPEITAALDKLN